MIWVTGDKHGEFGEVDDFCRSRAVTRDDTLVILGDAGINYYADARANALRQHLAQLPITLFCIHGNHEMRPEHVRGMVLREGFGGRVYADPRYPNIVYPVDGALYDLGGRRCLVIGGAYSVDKYDRLINRWPWFDDEQPSPAIRARTEAALETCGWQVDAVLSHTCPYSYIPPSHHDSLADGTPVDTSTERWLDSLRRRLTFRRWYCGHHHIDFEIPEIAFLYHDIKPLKA